MSVTSSHRVAEVELVVSDSVEDGLQSVDVVHDQSTHTLRHLALKLRLRRRAHYTQQQASVSSVTSTYWQGR